MSKTTKTKPAPYIPADKDQILERLRDMVDSHERDAILVNVEADGYTRACDLEADLADLDRRNAERPE